MKQEIPKATRGTPEAVSGCWGGEAQQAAAPCEMDRELQGSDFHEPLPWSEGLKQRHEVVYTYLKTFSILET